MTGPLAGDREVRQVLRYWLGALRFEESLASRPRANRPQASAGLPEDPSSEGASQPYFRLGIDHAPFWISARGEAVAALEPGVSRFLRHWVRRQLRRPSSLRSSNDEAELPTGAWIAGWPAVFFERRDEIATLFRFPVQIDWRRGGAPWDALDPITRRLARRDSPDEVVVRAFESDDEEPPALAIDRHLLHTTFGFLEDEIAELEARWRANPDPVAVVGEVLRWLSPKDAPAAEATPAARFRDVVQALRGRLGSGVSVYPTGIIQDGALTFATHHLQRELVELVSTPPGTGPLRPGTALWSYLTGAPSSCEHVPLRGRFRARGLTASQRAAAELTLGSRLAAVQGPPGTGKTEVILSLAADALVKRIEDWARGRSMNDGLMVVASTNNRAVDNAIDPISSRMTGDRLPLALRTGSQELTRTITARELARAHAWLLAQTDASASEQLGAARAELRVAGEELQALMAPHVTSMQRAARLRALRRELATTPAPASGDARAAATLHEGLVALRAAISRLLKSAGARRTKVSALEKAWARTALELVAPIALLRPDFAAALALPPPEVEGASDRPVDRAAWREALEVALEEVAEAVEELRAEKRAEERRTRALGELAALEAAPAEPPADAATELEIERRAHALFEHALEVRERWAILNRGPLIETLARAGEAASKMRTVRQFFDTEAGTSCGLRALYPVIGCTLLSLGNVFKHSAGEIDALVIDEAGQCHPAFPVSGLGRARRTAFIGDVHQLPPVVTLSRRDEARIRQAAGVAIDDERFAPFVIHDRAGTSAQTLADRAVPERPTLVDHFRCQPAIIAMSDALCGYQLAVHTPPRSLSGTIARLVAPVLFDAVHGAQVRERGSWANEAELERLIDLLQEIRAAGLPLSEVGVLTPYVGQLHLARQLLRRRGIPLEATSEERDATQPALALFGPSDALSIGTVHRFQGGERSVILLSTVITRAEDRTFLDERANLLNVAISRARVHLVTFGCEELLRGGKHTRLLVERAARLP